MNLAIYSKDYEIDLDSGMNGKVFLDDKISGEEFNDVDEAFKYICKNNIRLDRIEYNYSDDGVQYFKKFDFK